MPLLLRVRFFSELKYSQITEVQTSQLNAPITREEVLIASKSMPSGKAAL